MILASLTFTGHEIDGAVSRNDRGHPPPPDAPDNSVGIPLKSHANYNSNSDTNVSLLFLLWHVLPSARCKLAVAVNSHHIV